MAIRGSDNLVDQSQPYSGFALETNSPLFEAQVEVIDDEITVFVESAFVFTKTLSYYLFEGRPGFFVDTVTDIAFRRVKIKNFPETKE